VSARRALALVDGAADAAVVRAALAIGETTVLSVGQDDAPLVQACAAGAARALRLWDDALGAVDFLGLATALAAAARTALGDLAARPTVVVAGDRGRGAVGPAVAERLGLPHLTRILGVGVDDDRVIVRRHAHDHVRLFVAPPPCLICVLGDGTPLGDAGGTAAPETWTLAQAGLAVAEVGYRKRFRPQPGRGPVATPRAFADVPALVARLRSDGVLPQKGR
jgi:hypothetical protein